MTDGRTDGPTDGQTDRRTYGPADGLTDRRTNGRTTRLLELVWAAKNYNKYLQKSELFKASTFSLCYPFPGGQMSSTKSVPFVIPLVAQIFCFVGHSHTGAMRTDGLAGRMGLGKLDATDKDYH